MVKREYLFLLIGLVILQSCAMHIGKMNPSPKLDLSKTEKSIFLALDNDIKDSFTIPEYSGIDNSDITDWRASLQSGFENGFKNFFTINATESGSDLILKLLKTDLKFIPVNVSGYNNSTVLNVEIDFSAELLDGNNQKINGIIDKAKSQKTINVKGRETAAIESAIENMYQLISTEFFK